LSTFLERIRNLSGKQLAVLALRLNDELEQARKARSAPVAVIGMGCRFPGGIDGPDAYWHLLIEGREAIREVPADRWSSDAWFSPDPDAPGKMSAKVGGFLDDIGEFDPGFFGITPREAETMDPQQRLLLEVTWETLEHAGIAPPSLAGSATGVFVGLCNSDHFQRVQSRGADRIDAYLASGNAPSVASGRVSYTLGLQGPALTVDTACSSSLVALHLAMTALRSGGCSLALAGGVNVICAPETMLTLSKAKMLAADGRCKAFDAAADGFARGEGCGLVALKLLADAERDGDRIHAILRGSAINHDGRSTGLTVPSRRAQEELVRAALADAGIEAAEVGYVEAHGTGTRLGDPIEMRALAAAFGEGRDRSRPLLVGSAKTNFGHLESAAGIAGVLKAVLALEHGRIPPHLHFRSGNPDIDWENIPVEIPVAARHWPEWAPRRIAGVSSFGFSGTNAHVLLEAAPKAARTTQATARSAYCLPLSARTPGALDALAGRHGAVLADGAELDRVAATLGCGRTPHPERLAVVAESAAGAAAALAAAAIGRDDPCLRRGRVEAGPAPGIVFLCTGQGAQYPGMARALLEGAPAFREVVERCDAALGPQADGQRLLDVLKAGTGLDASIHRTEWTQPALYAVECGLAALWRSWGIQPAAVIGHSAGEFAAAAIAGVFELEDGARLVAERGRLLGALPKGGTMAAIFVTEAEARQAIAPHGDSVSLAAVNARDSVVISGRADAVDAVLAEFAVAGVQGHRLRISFAAHSPLVDGAIGALEEAASRVPMREPQIPVAWNLTGGRPLPTGAPDPSYWGRHLRAPVEFARGMARLREDGARVFLEVGPHPVLSAIAARDVVDGVDPSVFVGSLRRDHDDWRELAVALAELYVHGAGIDWSRVAGMPRPRPLALPTYPFERRRYWIETGSRPAIAAEPLGADPFLAAGRGPGRTVFETTISATEPAWLADHVVHGGPLVAGPVYLHMAVAAARASAAGCGTVIEDFEITAPLRLGTPAVPLRTTLERSDGSTLRFSVESRGPRSADEWVLHASGSLAEVSATTQGTIDDPAAAARMLAPDSAASFYDRLAGFGVDLSGRFRSLTRLHCAEGEALALAELPRDVEPFASPLADPGLLDGALQAAGATISPGHDALYLLTGVDRIVLASPLPPRLWCHAVLRTGSGDSVRLVDVALYDQDGRGLGRCEGVRLTRADAASARRPRHFAIEWEEAPLPVVAAHHLAVPAQHQTTLDAAFRARAEEHGLAIYDDLLPLADRIAAAQIVAGLADLGFDARAGRRFGVADEAQRLGIADEQQRLFARLLAILAEDGFLAEEPIAGEPGYRVAGDLPVAEAATHLAAARMRFAESAELALLDRCGGELADVLSGTVDPLELLFPGGSLTEARKLYVESAFARTYNATLAAFLGEIVSDVPKGARLRVLEIGGGTGGSTAIVLDTLGAMVDYTFTDVSPLFLQHAANRFGHLQGFSTAYLDIEAEPAGHGQTLGVYDIVLAANVLHATRDLAAAVANARSLLAPGGILVLIEGARPERWVDLTFGLTPGWWRFADHGLRPDYPLIGPEAWRRLLSAAGLSDVALIGGDPELGRGGQQMLIVARCSTDHRRIRVVGGPDTLREALAPALSARGAVAVAESEPADDILYLGALGLAGRARDDISALAEAEAASVLEPLRLLQALAGGAPARLWAATAGVHAVGSAPPAPGARWQAPLHGLGRVAALEIPGAWGGLIDLDPEIDPVAQATEIAETILASDAEDQCAWRGGNRLVPRLRETPAPTAAARFDRNATYLVTGGFGGLGAAVGLWLAEQGAGRVALLGRNPDFEGPAIQAIRAAGAEAVALSADVADASALAEALETLDRQGPPLRGAVHAAAQLDASPLADLDADRIHAMLRPKIAGTLALEAALRARGADFLVLFSTTTAVLGAAGFAHYAAANAFLDASALTAAPAKLRVISIGWGIWESMRLASADVQKTYAEQGLQPMPVEPALSALGAVLGGNSAHGLVAAIDWPRLLSLHETRRPRPMLSGLAGVAHETAAPAAANPGGIPVERPAAALRARLDGAPESMRREILLGFVATEAAAVMGQSRGEEVPRDRGLFELGMDSLMSVDLRRRLESGTGLSLPATITFNHPSVAALADVLAAHLAVPTPGAASGSGGAAQNTEPATPPSQMTRKKQTDDLDSLSDEEVAALLRERLGALR
jgi:acyl transferase domain-containing protein